MHVLEGDLLSTEHDPSHCCKGGCCVFGVLGLKRTDCWLGLGLVSCGEEDHIRRVGYPMKTPCVLLFSNHLGINPLSLQEGSVWACGAASSGEEEPLSWTTQMGLLPCSITMRLFQACPRCQEKHIKKTRFFSGFLCPLLPSRAMNVLNASLYGLMAHFTLMQSIT